MPPHGLYKLPSTLRNNSSPSPSLPRFNTMDFADDDDTSEKAAIEKAAQIIGGMTSAAGKKSSKKDEKKRRRSEGDAKERGPGANETPVGQSKEEKKDNKKKEKGGNGAHGSEKKRKRDSDMQAGPSAAAHNQDVGASVKRSYSVDQLTEVHSKKKLKSKHKSTGASTEETQEQSHSRGVKPVEATSTEEPAKSKKSKKSKKDRKSTSLQTPDASNSLEADTQSHARKDKSPYFTTPKNTPIPLPPKLALLKTTTATATTTAGSPQERPAQDGCGVTEVLVVETPPSRMSRETKTPWKTPVPFKLPGSNHSKGGNDVREYSNQGPSLTSSNLQRYTEPINDKPKPRPRGARAESVASVSSMSIKDAFARQRKPSPIESYESNEESTPFFTPNSSHKHPPNHFITAFETVHSLIDFFHEKQHLIAHLTWRASNAASGPPPCLSKATGCDASKERALLALKEDTSNLLSLAIASDAGSLAFDRAVAASRTAETFLHNAILAQIPVPVGDVEGIYTLYCPTYAETHMDKYGFGQRTLSISKPKGFTSPNYNARLFCPPRSMVYSTMSFTVPSHASFGPTTLTTSAERYTMELVVLGNGYILLKVDLGLFLRGKKAEDGAGEMEFLGVRERDVKSGEGAMEWDGVDEEVGEMVEKKHGERQKRKKEEVEQTPKKKVGRPTNVERARRAAEKEKEAAERDEA